MGIAHMEAAAIPWALKLFREKLCVGSTIYFGVDNQNAMFAAKKGYSSVSYLQTEVDKFMQLAVPMGWRVLFHYVPTKLNWVSDDLSRSGKERQWRVSPSQFRNFLIFCKQRQVPSPEVDGFATRNTSQCLHFHSQHLDLGSFGNFFHSNLDPNKCYWLCPPWSNQVVSRVFHTIKVAECCCWILLPNRTNSSWKTWMPLAGLSYKFSEWVWTGTLRSGPPIPQQECSAFFFDFRGKHDSDAIV